MYRTIGVVAVLALAGCGGAQSFTAAPGTIPSSAAARAAGPATAFVSFYNKTPHAAALYVEWSYAGSPVWQTEHSACIQANRAWHTNVVYHEPGKGPQIRMYARTMRSSDCSDLFSIATRFVAFKGLTFINSTAYFTAEVFTQERVGTILCARGDGFPEQCDATDGYPPLAKVI